MALMWARMPAASCMWGNEMDEVRKLKRFNYTALGILAVLLLAFLAGGLIARERRSFRTEKWISDPENRTRIVDDLLADHELVGMTEEEIQRLLGGHDNESGYFQQEDRLVYWLGPERGWISIDSEWLILDLSEGVVRDCFITRD